MPKASPGCNLFCVIFHTDVGILMKPDSVLNNVPAVHKVVALKIKDKSILFVLCSFFFLNL